MENLTAEQIEMTNLRGEVEYLRVLVYALLSKQIAEPNWSVQLADSLKSARKRLGEKTPERIAFDNAASRNTNIFGRRA